MDTVRWYIVELENRFEEMRDFLEWYFGRIHSKLRVVEDGHRIGGSTLSWSGDTFVGIRVIEQVDRAYLARLQYALNHYHRHLVLVLVEVEDGDIKKDLEYIQNAGHS